MLYFMRHGQSQAQADERYADDDSILTELGKQQATPEGKRLHADGITFDRIITSPILRARQTAELVADVIGLTPDDIRIDTRIAEYDLGSTIGKLFSEVPKEQRTSQLGAENPLAFRGRIRAALIDASKLSGNTLLVSHTGVSRMIEAIRTDYDPHAYFNLDGAPNAKAVQLDITGLIE